MDINNKWKIRFFTYFIISFGLIFYLLYNNKEQANDITYLNEVSEDMENDLNQLSKIIERKLDKKDFDMIIKRYDGNIDTQLGLSQIKIIFYEDGKVKKVTSKW